LHGGKLERFGFWAVRVTVVEGKDAVTFRIGFFVPVGSHSCTLPALACKSADRADAIASLFKVKVFAAKVLARLLLELLND
jgi:hypothetical protein